VELKCGMSEWLARLGSWQVQSKSYRSHDDCPLELNPMPT